MGLVNMPQNNSSQRSFSVWHSEEFTELSCLLQVYLPQLQL